MRIWIDLVNSPQVLFFRPIIAELQHRGHNVTITARDFAQTVALARKFHMEFQVVGDWTVRKSLTDKLVRSVIRVGSLIRYGIRSSFDLAINFGSHTHIIAARLLGIPCVAITDFEFNPASKLSLPLATRVVVPDILGPVEQRKFRLDSRRLFTFPGIKEDIYLSTFQPDPNFKASIPIPWDEKIIVVVRPPGTSLYQHFEHPYFETLMEYLAAKPNVFIVLLPRFPEQGQRLKSTVLPDAWIPPTVLDGPQLIYHSDLVITAVGTMGREAAVLGTPAYNLFAGKMGVVELGLIERGKVVHIGGEQDFQKIVLEKNASRQFQPGHSREIITYLVDTVIATVTSK